MTSTRQPTSRERARSLILVAGLGVVAAALLMVFVLQLISRGSGENQLGDSTFNVGRATRLAPIVDRDGPLLFPDLRSHSRQLNVYVQHVGHDPKTGWLAFDAHTQDPTCLVRWNRALHQLRDCRGKVYPPDGAGLTHYKTTVSGDGTVVVDLRSPT